LAGVLIDLFYDHFLVKNWLEYSEIPVADFSLDVYKVLQDIGAVSQPVRDYACNY
jgi:acyl carrier protein phosphodiesterase